MFVRSCPKADKRTDVLGRPLCAIRVITRRSKKTPLFDHLVGDGEERLGHGETEGLGGWKTDHERSSLVGNSPGRSPGLAPFKILTT